MLKEHLSTFLKQLTTEPGVYRMRDMNGQVIYVGKASNLKKRVSSYFTKTHLAAKTNQLVLHIESIDITVTQSEKEALLLESSLIKTLRPKYNVLMRDDKSYPYLRVTIEHDYPSLMMVRCKQKPLTKGYFGPYPNVLAVKETLNLIQKVFQIRNCTDVYFKARSRPCLQYQMKRCSAPCTQFILKQDYAEAVQDAIAFLQGKSQVMIRTLEDRMNDAVKRLAFEEAGVIRDQIQQLRVVQESQGVVMQRGDLDVIVMSLNTGEACVQWVHVRQGQILDSQAYYPKVPKDENIETSWQQVFEAFMMHFYYENPTRIPDIILTDHPVEDKAVLESVLSEGRGRRCSIQTSARGDKARWIDFARRNLASTMMSRHHASDLIKKRMHALESFLHMEKPIDCFVCFDISHTQGKETVASCVVFNDKGPLKEAYRRFNIQGITPGDDYAAMEQAITRYFSQSKRLQLPQLVVIDGGKGQVAVANRVLELLHLQYIKVLGIAKGPSRKSGHEQLIVSHECISEDLPHDALARHVLQHIRDEAHRFAITAHRKKRQKTGLSSSLTTIPGIGAKRRHALLQRFGGIQALAKASIEEMAKVEGISQSLAIAIYQHFHHEKLISDSP